MSYKTYSFEYIPALIGAKKRYILDLPTGEEPMVFWTMTTGMTDWYGEVLSVQGESAEFVCRGFRGKGKLVEPIKIGHPCVVTEHVTISGDMEYLLSKEKILKDNNNFVNYGVPGGRHLRIDIYTGEARVIG